MQMQTQSSQRLREMLYGTWTAQAVYAAARLDLADLVGAGVRDIPELASRTGTDPRSLYRLMRALASVGVFHEETPQRFALTPLADCLRSGTADTVKDLALFYGNEVFRSYAGIVDSVRSGAPAFNSLHEANLWDYFDGSPAAAGVFKRGMGAATWQEQKPLPETYDFSGLRCLVDVGGGEGSMLAAILHTVPDLRGVIVDVPTGVDRTMRHFVNAGVADRASLREGSAFDELPVADGYLMGCLLHVMDDDAAARVLGRTRDAIEPGGRVVIVERIVPPANRAALANFLDVTMLLVTGGKERTEEEWRQLLDRTGFALTRTVALPYFSGGLELFAIEGRPVQKD